MKRQPQENPQEPPGHLYAYRCEARQPGQTPHTFGTPDGEAARAMCDAHGWELIRVWQPGGDSDRAAGGPGKGDPALSGAQLRCLAIEAGKTYKMLAALDLADDLKADAWRHAQVLALTGRAGLSQCQNSHYTKLLRHFKKLRGEQPTGPAFSGAQSGEGGDTLERREQLVRLLGMELGSHAQRVNDPKSFAESTLSAHAKVKGGPIGEGYLLGLARAKNPGCSVTDYGSLITLPASRLEHLHSTLRNRIAAREGRGKAKARNTKQRKPLEP